VAEKIKMNRSPVTLKDISQRTGYSVNTISHALNGKKDISDKTRKLITETAEEMGYIRNSLAGALRSGITGTIAVIVSDISNPLFGIMVKEMERLLRKWDINLFIMNTNEDAATEEKAVLSALSHNVDGLIICPTQKNSNILHRLDQEHVPYVLLGRKPNEEGTSNYVVWDDMQGGYEATKYLLSLGHQRILCLSGPSYISSARERLAGYHKALYEAGIPLRPELIHEVQPVGEDLKGILTDSLALRDGFTAVFAFSDMIAWETVYQLNELGKKVPEDISVVGFDGIQSKMPFPCKLTTILTPKTKMATLVVKTLMNLIYQRSETVTQTTIPVKLIVRDTTRAR
jgi:LacI family transcriptional regulator